MGTLTHPLLTRSASITSQVRFRNASIAASSLKGIFAPPRASFRSTSDGGLRGYAIWLPESKRNNEKTLRHRMQIRLDEWLKREFDPPPVIRTDRIWTNSGKFFPRRSRSAVPATWRKASCSATACRSCVSFIGYSVMAARPRIRRRASCPPARLLRLAQSDPQIDNHKCPQSVDPFATSNPMGRYGCSNGD